VLMNRQHVPDGRLTIRQQKTGTEVSIPILPELRECLDAVTSMLQRGDSSPERTVVRILGERASLPIS
jgi:hypothetical protein